ncbi:McrB family protein [Salinibaculum salinum]|uniref:McrB family protein n=1 Tax=Salinibaculum salinum TaxID=3131996 RepID=UPI0030EC00A2
MSSELILAPAANPTQQTIFKQLAQAGVPTNTYSTLDTPSIITHVYPLPTRVSGDDFDEASFVLFYEGRNEYTWAAPIHQIEENNSLVQDLLGDAGIDGRDRDSYSDCIAILGVPFQIDIPSHELHAPLDLEGALTAPLRLSSEQLAGVLEGYDSLTAYLQTQRTAPTVWFDTGLQTTSDNSPETDLVIYSENQDQTPLREATVGDIVLNLSEETNRVTSVSVIGSTTRGDYEQLPDELRFNEHEPAIYRTLTYVTPLNTPLDLYDDLLGDAIYQPRLHQLLESEQVLFYDSDLSLRPEHYLTPVPLELLYLFLAELPELYGHLQAFQYELPFPDPAETYDTDKEAIVDIRIRMAFADLSADWFRDALTARILETVTETLDKVSSDTALTHREASHCELISTAYEQMAPQLTDLAGDYGIGRVAQLVPAKVLFMVRFRDLQAAAGLNTNMDPLVLKTVLTADYTVEATDPQVIDTDDAEPLTGPSKPNQADEIARQLQTVGQMVFYGPPGTSKTYTAERFAKWWLHQQPGVEPTTRHLTTVTFHPSFTYEDFLEGLSAEATDNGVAYDHKPGVFKTIADRARREYTATPDDESPPKFVLIIDEINRGNLAQIFGETMTALEYNKRTGQPDETTVTLAHTGEPFSIPPNLYLIGTMNTADRSIALVDTALRRRFRFLSFPPDFEALYGSDTFAFDSQANVETAAGNDTADNHLLAQSILTVQHFNTQIIGTADLGKGKQIGHSFFFGVNTRDEVVDLWRFELLPLLEEYFFGQFDRIQDILFAGGGTELLDYDRQEITTFDADTLETALTTLLRTTGRVSE